MDLFSFFKRKLSRNKSKFSTEQDENPTSNVELSVNDKNNNETIYLQPLSNGLLPGEIILINWIEGKYINSNFPKYFSYQYRIDPKRSINKLLKESFIAKADIFESLNYFKISALKDILRENGLKVSGKKEELINRLTNHLTEDEVKGYIDEKPLKITSQGQQVLEDYDYILAAHKNSSKDDVYNVGTAINYVNQLNYKPTNSEIAHALFQKALTKYHSDFQFGLYRNVHHSIATQLERENDLKDALLYQLKVCVIDLSGLGNGAHLDKPDHVMIAPGIINKIKHLIDELNCDRECINKLFQDTWDNIINELPFHYLDKEGCYQCLIAALNDNENYIKEKIQKSYDAIDSEIFEETYNLKLPIENYF